MLVDVKQDEKLAPFPEREQEIRRLLGEMGDLELHRIKHGFYITGLNPHIMLHNTIKNEWPIFGDHTENEAFAIRMLNCYGVCDSPEQLIEMYEKLLENDPRKLFVTLWKVDKEEQPKNGGWRWHKWGPYIGNKKPKHEYIRNEDNSIQVVYCYHIREAN